MYSMKSVIKINKEIAKNSFYSEHDSVEEAFWTTVGCMAEVQPTLCEAANVDDVKIYGNYQLIPNSPEMVQDVLDNCGYCEFELRADDRNNCIFCIKEEKD